MILIIILAILTLGVLVIGLLIMAKGGKVNQKYSNKLMVARVVMQGLTLFAMALLLVVTQCNKEEVKKIPSPSGRGFHPTP